MKNYVKRIAATAVMTAVCLGATMQLGLPSVAYAVKEAADAPVMMTVNGQDVRKGEYAQFFSYTKTQMESMYGVGPYLWSMQEGAEQALVASADQACMVARIAKEQFDKLGLRLGTDKAWEYKNFQKQIGEVAAAQGTDFKGYLEMLGLTEGGFRNLIARDYYMEALQDYYFGEGGEKAPAEDEIRDTFNDSYFRVKHILIKNTDENGDKLTGDALAAKEATLKEVQDKLAAGEDFDALMEQYGEDPGMKSSPEGYLIDQDGATLDGSYMVSEFTEGATALAIDEVSAPVESSFGWHIIKRVPATEEDYQNARLAVIYAMTGESINGLLNQWVDEAEVSYPDGHEDLTIVDILGEDAAAPSLSDLMGGASSSTEE
ncbi:MAG: peptidylprolyl isomerase [Butyricicoccus pullicaecorum]|nr:peptidylprolyl isomerase [Butyricicoccus pullicaecorum]